MRRARNEAAPLAPADFAAAFHGLAGLPGSLLVAVSGGADSTALMHGLAAWSSGRDGARPVVATVNHGLRVEAAAEAEAVATAAAALGLGHRLLVWPGARAGPVSQDAARRARYRLLAACAAEIGAAVLVTVHTLDDQAETVLIRLAAGSGLSGLGGMRAVAMRGRLAHHRPLLRIPKARLVATCRSEGWAFAEDPSNRDPRFARTRWRALAPTLAAEGLDAECLSRLARRLRRADGALDHAAGQALSRCALERVGAGIRLDFGRLVGEPEEIALRVLASTLRESGAAAARLERLEACCEALLDSARAARPARRTLAGRVVALDRAGTLTIAPEPPRSRGGVRPVTVPAAGTPHSLGNEGAGA